MSITATDVSYGTKKKNILKNVSLEIKQNEIVSLVGPNGAGKSTFLQILAGDFEPDSGFIQYDGIKLTKISIQERSFCRSVMSQSQRFTWSGFPQGSMFRHLTLEFRRRGLLLRSPAP